MRDNFRTINADLSQYFSAFGCLSQLSQLFDALMPCRGKAGEEQAKIASMRSDARAAGGAQQQDRPDEARQQGEAQQQEEEQQQAQAQQQEEEEQQAQAQQHDETAPVRPPSASRRSI